MSIPRSLLRARRTALYTLTRPASAMARRRTVGSDSAEAARFQRLCGEFEERYRAIASVGAAGTTPPWQAYSAELERVLLPVPPANFLRLPIVMETMLPHSVSARRRQLAYLRTRHNEGALARLLVEDTVGTPPLVGRYPTSPNRVHLLAHVARWAEQTGVDPAGVTSIVEWGGGYGGMCRLWRLLGAQTYTILDLPIVSAMQWLYLASVLGEDEVILHERAATPVEGRINLMPAAPSAPVDAQLFVSTWALSETSAAVQDEVADRQFFGADHLLIAFQHGSPDFPDGPHLESALRARSASVEAVPGQPSSRYAFA